MPIASPAASADYFARFQNAPSPRLLPVQVVEFLSKTKGGKYALERLRTEENQLSDIEADLDGFEMRIYKLSKTITQHRSDDRINAAQAASRTGVPQDVKRNPELEDLDRQLAVTTAKRNERADKGSALNRRLAACKRLVASARMTGTKITFASPARADGDLPVTRAHIVRCVNEIVALEQAPVALAEAKARLERWINANARPMSVAPLFNAADGGPYVPMKVLPATNGGAESPDILGIWLSMNRDQIFADLSAQLERDGARDDDAAVLNEADRLEKIDKCKDKILALERAEASLEWQAMEAGEIPELRADADPLAILSAYKQ